MRSEQGEGEAWQPRDGIASYLDRISIRSEHRRRQGSEDRISDHISIGMEQEANTGEDEAGQPREDSASYLNRSSIRNEHRWKQAARMGYRIIFEYTGGNQGSYERIM